MGRRSDRSTAQGSNTAAHVLYVWVASFFAYVLVSMYSPSYAILALSFGSLVMLVVFVAGAARSRRKH